MDKIIKYINNSNKPIYVYGKSGSGKTTILKNIPFSVKFISIQDINSYEQLVIFSQPSIIEKMNNTNKTQVCVIDDIDYLQNNDKKILTSLLKQFKQEEKKKLKRNFKLILCGTNNYDKKIKEILKLCNVVNIVNTRQLIYNNYEKNIQNNIKKIMNKEFKDDFIIENEKATQSLLFHENIIDTIKTTEDIMFYKTFLKNYCIGDYFDRISFQKQLWIFNEITYYFKVLHNYNLYKKTQLYLKKSSDYRFTKVLTKYSNEYNNNNFIIDICNKLNCSKKDLFYFILNKTPLDITNVEINRCEIYFQLKD
jgi:chromosomal replication initiation ATPase DnaA